MSENKDKHQPKGPVDVSIITVNYNGFEDTCEMIESIYEHVHTVSFEIIVVDNDSDMDELQLITGQFESVRSVQSPSNVGFARGNNLGASMARGRYLFFLNNDTLVKDDNIRHMVNRLDADPSIGGVSPMLRYADEEGLVQFAGFTPLSRYTLRNRSIGNGEPCRSAFLKPCETPYLHGAAMMVRRELMEKTGGLPIQYFLYYEELDWSLSIRSLGYRLWYEPACTVYHKESRSTGLLSPLKTFYLARNRFLFAYRNSSKFDCFITHAYLLLCVALRDAWVYKRKKRLDLKEAMIAGIRDYYSLEKNQKKENYGYKHTYFLS